MMSRMTGGGTNPLVSGWMDSAASTMLMAAASLGWVIGQDFDQNFIDRNGVAEPFVQDQAHSRIDGIPFSFTTTAECNQGPAEIS